MVFFDLISKRLTDAGQGVMQHTRDLTDTTRLNMKIAENKKKMSQLLFEMGHDYYQKHRKDTNNEEQDYINQVNVLFQEIMNCQDEIERIKTADVCKVCGTRMTEGASFCISCGTRLGTDALEDNKFISRCPVCGSEVEEDSVFCTACGIRLPDEDDESMEIGDKLEEATYYPRVCPVCGTEVEEHDLFCLNCGMELSNMI